MPFVSIKHSRLDPRGQLRLRRHLADRIARVACGTQCLSACALLGHVTLRTPSLPVALVLLATSMGLPGLIIGNPRA